MLTRVACRAVVRSRARQVLSASAPPRAFFSTSGTEWRQRQLQKIKDKFDPPLEIVETEDDLQSMWRAMEGRVTKKRPRTVEETGGKTGRANIKKTDEEIWLREGLYDDGEEEEDKSLSDK